MPHRLPRPPSILCTLLLASLAAEAFQDFASLALSSQPNNKYPASIDPKGLDGKVIYGYQGWFRTPAPADADNTGIWYFV